MTRIVWTPQAIADIEAIRAYVARYAPQYAALLVERIVGAIDRLETSPRSGRVVPEIGEETLREVITGSYRVVYRLTAERVEIITVLHGARPLPPV